MTYKSHLRSKFVRPKRMWFGKYKGQPISRVISLHPHYALWAHKNLITFMLSNEEINDCLKQIGPDGG